jgi:hypothetical protein
MQLQQQARKLAQEFHDEKQKMEDAHRSEKLALEDKIMRMKNNEELMRSKMKDHIESNYQDLIRKHQTEVSSVIPASSLLTNNQISSLKEKADIEREQWMSRTLAKMNQDAKQHEVGDIIRVYQFYNTPVGRIKSQTNEGKRRRN